jgi:hypothetical protein
MEIITEKVNGKGIILVLKEKKGINIGNDLKNFPKFDLYNDRNQFLGSYYKYPLFKSLYFHSSLFKLEGVDVKLIGRELNNFYTLKNGTLVNTYNKLSQALGRKNVKEMRIIIEDLIEDIRHFLKEKLKPEIKNNSQQTTRQEQNKELGNDGKPKIGGLQILSF